MTDTTTRTTALTATTTVARSDGAPDAVTIAVWNPASGSAPDEGDLREALGADIELVETTPDDPGPGQTRDAIAAGAKTIVACGGDGTVRAIAEAAIGTDVILDIVPLGTGNLLAGNLGIDSGLPEPGSVGRRAATTTIDVGRVNGEVFTVMAGSGFDAFMIGEADDDRKARLGVLAYVMSGARNLRRALEPTTVTVDGETFFRGRTSMVLVGNHGTITGGLEVFPEADPTDGRLDLAVLSAETLRDWVTVLWRLLRGGRQPDRLVRRASGRSIVIETRSPRAYELDGEARDPVRRLEIDVEPSALRLHTNRPERPDGEDE